MANPEWTDPGDWEESALKVAERALELIIEGAANVRPGHVAYKSKQQLADIAERALADIRGQVPA